MSNTLYAHPFRKDGITHAVFTIKRKVKRNGKTRVICGPRLDKSFQRLAPSIHRMGLTPITCDGCVASLTGIRDALDKPAHTPGANKV